MSTPVPEHLNNPHHRKTLLHVFQHPTSHNIEWHDVLSLLEALGSVELSNDGDYAVHVGAETAFVGPKKDKDLEIEQVLAVRELLTPPAMGRSSRLWQTKVRKS